MGTNEIIITQTDYIKQRTIQLYDSLPQVYDERISRLDIRDQIIELNYSFFGYVASHTFINNSSVTYEDKFQSTVLHFCECWWKWRYNGDASHRGYRSDLSFAVFFKPRVGEMVERELNEVKYSLRRSLCMEVGAQLGKHWGKVTYEDLSNPNLHLSADKMISLKAIFGSLYNADLDEHETYLSSTVCCTSILNDISAEYDTVEDLLVEEMIRSECKLSEAALDKLSEIYGIDINILRAKVPVAENLLYRKLQDNIRLQQVFDSE